MHAQKQEVSKFANYVLKKKKKNCPMGLWDNLLFAFVNIMPSNFGLNF